MNPNFGVETLREPIFDTLVAAKTTALATRILMFVTQQGPTVGPEITSMVKSAELPNPEYMKVLRIVLDFVEGAKADIIGIVKNYALKVVVSGQTRFYSPLVLLGETANGISEGRFVFDLPEGSPIEIEQGANFRVELVSRSGYTLTDANAGLFVRCLLDGFHTVARS